MYLELDIAWLEENGVEAGSIAQSDFEGEIICAVERVGTWDVYLMENESMLETFQSFCKNRKRWFLINGDLLK